MIVDDHEMVAASLVIALEDSVGIEIVGQAANGSEGIEMVGKLLPDVVLMDIQMPVMDGITATKLIHQKYPQVKIIALTASTSTADKEAALAAGAHRFLQKEAHFTDEILEAIYKALR
ncbi:MAG: response regulator transcription factor [Chloroflexota bacterium]